MQGLRTHSLVHERTGTDGKRKEQLKDRASLPDPAFYKNHISGGSMKKGTGTPILVALMVIAFMGITSLSFAQTTAKPKEKGPALQQLENAAGKKIEDVKVPEVPKPTPVAPQKGK
jgi:hypothetical protein